MINYDYERRIARLEKIAAAGMGAAQYADLCERIEAIAQKLDAHAARDAGAPLKLDAVAWLLRAAIRESEIR